VYRLLAGYAAFTAAGQTIPYAGVPMAIAPSTYNQTEATNQVRVAYGVGSGANQVAWGAWCGTCHPAMVSGVGKHYHPVDGNAVMGAGKTQTVYNQYISSGNMRGSSATAYLSLVPFMTGSNDVKILAFLADNSGAVAAAREGPGSSAQVSCLSCHRAHASGFRDALRWNVQGEFITHATSTGAATWPGTDTTPGNPTYADGMVAAQIKAAYYDRPVTVFRAFQRSLCNKCHAAD
jgi:cytochrome c553